LEVTIDLKIFKFFSILTIHLNAVDILEVNSASSGIKLHWPIAIHVDDQIIFAHDEKQMECNARGKMIFEAMRCTVSFPNLILK
jgi:hypothetical protein